MSMSKKNLKNVLSCMERLEARIVELIHAHDDAMARRDRTGHWETDPLSGSAFSGAVRRASMDLTRALAGLRKP